MDKLTEQYLLEVVKSNYENIAVDFSATRQNLRWLDLESYTAKVLADQSVLDVGCGDGRLLSSFKNGFRCYVGVEPSAALAKIAQEKGEREKVKVVVGDILKLNKNITEKFDWVFCIAVLHHIPGCNLQIEALKKLRERLNDNGRIVISVWRMWQWPKLRTEIIKQALKKIIGLNKMDLGDILFDWKKGERSLRYYHFFTERGLRKIIAQAGLEIEHWERGEKNHYVTLKK